MPIHKRKLLALREAAASFDRLGSRVSGAVFFLGLAIVAVNLDHHLPLSSLASALCLLLLLASLTSKRSVAAAACLWVLPRIEAPNSQLRAKQYKNRDGQMLHVVPPSAVLLQRISHEIGPQYAAMFNSTGNKLRSFKRPEAAAGQWETMADRWVRAIRQTRELRANNTGTASGSANGSTSTSTSSSSAVSMEPLLCVHFSYASPAVVALMHANMASAGDWCHWAVIFYAGEAAIVDAYRAVTQGDPRIALVAAYKPPGDHLATDFVPKPLLYTTLLPVLPRYRRVWLLDSDISLAGFDMKRYLAVLACAERAGPVLISQPVIRESTQDFPLLNRDFWTQPGLAHVQAARCVGACLPAVSAQSAQVAHRSLGFLSSIRRHHNLTLPPPPS